MTLGNDQFRINTLADRIPVNNEIARDSKIIPLPSTIVPRPTNLATGTEAANLLIKPPVTAGPVSPTAIAVQPLATGAPVIESPVTDPGPVATEGMGAKLMAWAKANPVPAIVIGVAGIYLLSKMLKGK